MGRERLTPERAAEWLRSAARVWDPRGEYPPVMRACADLLDHLRAALAQAEQERDRFAPGQWRCPECDFQLTMKVLAVNEGKVGMSLKRPDPCPNDGSAMVRISWREVAESQGEWAKGIMERLFAAEDRAEAAEARSLSETERAALRALVEASGDACMASPYVSQSSPAKEAIRKIALALPPMVALLKRLESPRGE